MVDNFSCEGALIAESGTRTVSYSPTALSQLYRRQGHDNDGKIPAPREIPSYDFRHDQIQSLTSTPPVMKDGDVKELLFRIRILHAPSLCRNGP